MKEDEMQVKKFVNLIEYKGFEVVYFDASPCTTQETLLQGFYELEAFFRDSEKRDLLYLANASGVFAGAQVVSEAKRITKEIVAPKLKRGAVFGLSGLHKILLKGVNLFSGIALIAFDTKEDALNYLVQE